MRIAFIDGGQDSITSLIGSTGIVDDMRGPGRSIPPCVVIRQFMSVILGITTSERHRNKQALSLGNKEKPVLENRI